MQAGTARKGAALTAMNTSTTTTSRYLIHANGTTMGIYLGYDDRGAVDAYAQDQGYDDAADMADVLDRTLDDLRAELEARKIDSIDVEDLDDAGDGLVDAEVYVRAGGSEWSGGVTLCPDRGRPTVGRRHPLGTCGTPLDGWASDGIREALRVLGDDLIGEIEHAVDTAARNEVENKRIDGWEVEPS